MKKPNKIQQLPEVFSSVDEAIILLKLDKRRKWFEWMGQVVYNFKYTAPNSCTGCDGGGCFECGGTGKRVSHVPIPAFMPDGSIVRVMKKFSFEKAKLLLRKYLKENSEQIIKDLEELRKKSNNKINEKSN